MCGVPSTRGVHRGVSRHGSATNRNLSRDRSFRDVNGARTYIRTCICTSMYLYVSKKNSTNNGRNSTNDKRRVPIATALRTIATDVCIRCRKPMLIRSAAPAPAPPPPRPAPPDPPPASRDRESTAKKRRDEGGSSAPRLFLRVAGPPASPLPLQPRGFCGGGGGGSLVGRLGDAGVGGRGATV